MTKAKLASLLSLFVTILTFVSARLKEPSTKAALVGLLAMVGLDAFAVHIDTIVAVLGFAALIVAVPDKTVVSDEAGGE